MSDQHSGENSDKKAEEQASPEGASSEGTRGPRWKHHGRMLWGEWIKPLLIIGFVMFSFRSAVADWNDVPTGSMKPTILEGDRIFINKLAYDLKFPFTRFRLAQWDDPEWGDVVVLLSPEDGKRLVKRVVGLPGDVLEIRGNRLFRNGEPATYTMLDPHTVDQIDPEDQPAFLFLSEDLEGREHPIMMRTGGMFRPGGHVLQPDEVPPGCFGEDETRDARPAPPGPWVCRVAPEHYFLMGDNRNNSRDSRYFGPVHRSSILGEATAVALSFDRERFYKPRWDRFFSDLP